MMNEFPWWMKWVVLGLFGLLFIIISALMEEANAAGFDCRKAKLPSEQTICNSGELSYMDDIMTSLYHRRSPVNDQKIFLKFRDMCDYDHICLVNAYEARIRQLCAETDWYGYECEAL